MKTKKLLFIALFLFSTSIFAQPVPPSGKKWSPVYELSDEFNSNHNNQNGTGINLNKWHDIHPVWSGRAPSAYKLGNATQSGGFLKLKSTLKKHPSTVANRFKDIWVNAASVVSKKKIARPGYFYEARIKASSLSMTSSFWFRIGEFSEIDVIEIVGQPSGSNGSNPSPSTPTKVMEKLPTLYNSNTHYYGKHKGLKNLKATSVLQSNARDSFINYGFWWKSPNELLFYTNSDYTTPSHKIIPRVPLDENLHLIFDTEVFPFAEAGIPSIGLPFPYKLNNNNKNTMYVDWLRTYKLEDNNNDNANNSSSPIGSVISLRKSGGNLRYITGEASGSQLIARANSVQGWEKFKVESHPKGGIALKALSNNRYIQVQNKNIDLAVRPKGPFKGDWEQFRWEPRGGINTVALKSVHTGKYLQAAWNEDNAIVKAKGKFVKGWETFIWKKEASATNLKTSLNFTPPNKINNTEAFKILKAFPNPAEDYVTIPGTNDVDVLVVNITGALSPVTIHTGDNKITIDLKLLNSGVYFVVLKSGEKIKFIKK